MDRKEFFEYLGIQQNSKEITIDPDEAEFVLVSFRESNHNYLEVLLGNYGNSLSKELKSFLISNLKEILLQDEKNVYIIFNMLVDDLRRNYFDFLELLDRLSEDDRVVQGIYIPLLYCLSSLCSKKTIFEDFTQFLSCLDVVCGLVGVRKELEKKVLWGLEYSENNYYTSFVYKNKGSCFLDGFFEPFVYKKGKRENPANNFYKKSPKELFEIRNAIIGKFEMLSRGLFEVIRSLISSSSTIKKNFIDYLILVINENQERSKIVFDYTKIISDGYSYNMNLVLRLFCEDLIRKNLINKINPEYSKELKTSSFTSLVFFGKIYFTEFSLVKFLEITKEFHQELGRLDLDNSLMAQYSEIIKSKCNALETLVVSELIREKERAFFNFVTDFLLVSDFSFPDNFYLTFLQMHKCLQTVDKNGSGDLLKVLEGLFKNNLFKSHIIEIVSVKPGQLKFTMINQIIEYYNSLQKEDDRFNPRHNINTILTESKAFDRLKICQRNIKFVNYMMGDFEYMLSNSLSAISEIKLIKKKMAESTGERVAELSSGRIHEENKARNGFIFVSECFRLLNHIIRANQSLLVVDELIGNFVSILNCNLKIIVGPKCYTLRIDDPSKYKFDPKNLLRQIILVYIQMDSPKFVEQVAREQMYFDLDLFRTALELAENKFILNQGECKDLKKLIKSLESVQKVEEVTSEFIDPLTYNPIRDPVKLLTSNVTVDRSTFNLIMLNDGIDPFNREVLDETKVVVDEEMKKKIELTRCKK